LLDPDRLVLLQRQHLLLRERLLSSASLDAERSSPGGGRPVALPEVPEDWAEFRRQLLGFVARRLPAEADAEDLVQEVFLKAAAKRDSLQDASRIVPWLLQIARRAIADFYRGRSRDTLGGARTTDDETTLEQLPDPAVDAQVEVDTAALAACMRPLVGALPPLYQEAVRRVELQDERQVDVARDLGLSISTLKSRVQRGRVQLKEALLACCEVSQARSGGITDFQPRTNSCGCGATELVPLRSIRR
jgi:RNA polymerase sigma-70 factor (ECF subfamily)